MKSFLALIVGFVLSIGMFVGGLAVATSLIASEPENAPGPSADVTQLWTVQPTRVDRATQDFERLPSVQPPQQPDLVPTQADDSVDVAALDVSGDLAALDDGTIDLVTTGSVENDWDPLRSAHVDWCSKRYRSYNPATNSYTSYSLDERPCVSPFGPQQPASDPMSASDLGWVEDQVDASPQVLLASEETPDGVSVSDHIAYCFSRYRSYRAEDNTYQPYGGGPRRQCR